MLESMLVRLLGSLSRGLPREHSLWCEAILAETTAIENSSARLQWLLGGVFVALRAYGSARIRGIVTDAEGQRLPVEIIVVAVYQCGFSLLLLGILGFQLPRITERWTDAIPALAIAFFAAMIPGVLGFGLFLLDNAARWGTLVFTIAHAVLGWHRIASGLVHPTPPILRIAFDAFILVALTRPGIIRRFMHRPTRLQLQ